MKLSHSKLSTILTCPMSYYLSYEQGISKKEEKPALTIGSAVHWGIEHNTEDLDEYFDQKFKTKDCFTKEQLLSEAMCHGYFKHKDEIFSQILTDSKSGEKAELLEECHELYVTGELHTNKFDKDHDFVGIIDLLLITNKGLIVIDYKTSTYEPDWQNYLDQIYRYIFLLNNQFPEIPIYKIGIINLRKSAIRQKKNENESQFLNRLRLEYELNDEAYVQYHEYNEDSLDKNRLKYYLENLSKMADTAQTIIDSKSYYINYAAANGQYGRSDFWDIFYHTPDAHVLYKISDTIYDEDEGIFKLSRDCLPIDMHSIDRKVFNKYALFENLVKTNDIKTNLKENVINLIKDEYEYDERLIDEYITTYLHQ